MFGVRNSVFSIHAVQSYTFNRLTVQCTNIDTNMCVDCVCLMPDIWCFSYGKEVFKKSYLFSFYICLFIQYLRWNRLEFEWALLSSDFTYLLHILYCVLMLLQRCQQNWNLRRQILSCLAHFTKLFQSIESQMRNYWKN